MRDDGMLAVGALPPSLPPAPSLPPPSIRVCFRVSVLPLRPKALYFSPTYHLPPLSSPLSPFSSSSFTSLPSPSPSPLISPFPPPAAFAHTSYPLYPIPSKVNSPFLVRPFPHLHASLSFRPSLLLSLRPSRTHKRTRTHTRSQRLGSAYLEEPHHAYSQSHA